MWLYPEIRTLGDIARYHARERPDDIAVITPIRSLSFAAFDAAASDIARHRADAAWRCLGRNGPHWLLRAQSRRAC
jgi:non-ribosomal peptide synthetase component E (peptide arylation enzyme)